MADTKMKPGRELDALVAEKVMGKTTHVKFDGGEYAIGFPHYSTDISAAWEVVEKFGHVVLSGPEVTSQQWCSTFSTKGSGWGDTAPHAICLAALKTMGVEV